MFLVLDLQRVPQVIKCSWNFSKKVLLSNINQRRKQEWNTGRRRTQEPRRVLLLTQEPFWERFRSFEDLFNNKGAFEINPEICLVTSLGTFIQPRDVFRNVLVAENLLHAQKRWTGGNIYFKPADIRCCGEMFHRNRLQFAAAAEHVKELSWVPVSYSLIQWSSFLPLDEDCLRTFFRTFKKQFRTQGILLRTTSGSLLRNT